MKIVVAGTRGIPDIPGGIEKHCQELYPLLSAMGHQVVLMTRRPYVADPRQQWQGVKLIHTFCPRSKSLEAILHTFVAVLKARWLSPDIVHIHAVGPGLMVPFARILGLRVVVTNHGPDYDRQKWGASAKAMLRLGEYLGGKYANEVIVVSEVIAAIVRRRCGRSAHIIYNGVPLPTKLAGTDHLERLGIRLPGQYILAVARFVPEKGLHDLIEAFNSVAGDAQLVIAGDADHETEYSNNLRKLASRDARITLTGYVTGEPLRQLYNHAHLFVLPSYHEGLPIALLEAMSYGLSVLVSDIPANREVNLPLHRYFKSGHVDDLAVKIHSLLKQRITEQEKEMFRAKIAADYDWQRIAEQTVAVYEKTLGRPKSGGIVGSAQ